MNFDAEARIAGELMKFAMSGQLYRGSKPVMWSVVEATALAEAEVEYHDYQSDTIWVKFPVVKPAAATPTRTDGQLLEASVVIWTTTPWTIPGNRAISYSQRIAYGLYEVTAAEDNWVQKPGETLILADALATDVLQANASVTDYKRLRDVRPTSSRQSPAPTRSRDLISDGYQFDVPLLDGDHVTDDAGTGFVHTAPGHGARRLRCLDGFHWRSDARPFTSELESIAATSSSTPRGFVVSRFPPPSRSRSTMPATYTKDAPGVRPGPRRRTGARHRRQGQEGQRQPGRHHALIDAGKLFARGRLKHHLSAFLAVEETDHLPQHAAVVRPYGHGPRRRHDAALAARSSAIDDTRFVPGRPEPACVR
jgi:isoleucyl-tRNA synthetase